MDLSDPYTVENHWDLKHRIFTVLHAGLFLVDDHFPVFPNAKVHPPQRPKPQGTPQ